MSLDVETRVRIPYVEGLLRPATAAWAKETDLDVEFIEVDPSSDSSYYELLLEWWSAPGDLVIVEQDNIPAEGSVEEMIACEFDWCSCPYMVHRGLAGETLWGWGLGCVKFSQALRRRYPKLMLLAGRAGEHDDSYPERTHFNVDVRLGCLLANRGVLPHGHAECGHDQHRQIEGVLT